MKLFAILKRYIAENRGAVSIEFVLSTILIMTTFIILLAIFEVFRAYHSISIANANMAGVVSRHEQIYDEDLEDLYDVFNLLANADEADTFMRVSVIENLGDSNFNVTWSWASAEGENDETLLSMDNDSHKDLIERLVPDVTLGDQVIFFETRVKYKPLTNFLAFDIFTFRERAALVPRFSARVINPDREVDDTGTGEQPPDEDGVI